MLVTGSQLKAARALAQVDQKTVAAEANLNINTIRAMERRGGETLASGLKTIRQVQIALEKRGVEFLNHGEPGVRLKKKAG